MPHPQRVTRGKPDVTWKLSGAPLPQPSHLYAYRFAERSLTLGASAC
jgi:hypothetical protein